MKVKCIEGYSPHLTEGKVYEVLEEDSKFYYCTGDSYVRGGHYKRRFKVVEEDNLYPLKMETVTKILPGRYGKVTIERVEANQQIVNLRFHNGLSKKELDQAISTLQFVRNAMNG